jgi:hypothetical protein
MPTPQTILPKNGLANASGQAAHSRRLSVILFTKSRLSDCAAVLIHGNLLENFRNFIEIQINNSEPGRASHIKDNLAPRIDHK